MSSNHKTLNGNLNLVATAAQQQQQQQQISTTTTNVNNLMKINSNNNNNIGDKITQQHHKQIAPNPISKLQQQQHHQQQQQQQFQQRRSLLPAITTSTAHQHHLTQQQSVTTAAASSTTTATAIATTTAGNNNNGAQSHQLQTVATIHQQHSQQQQQQHQSAISRNTTGAATAAAISSSTSTSAIPTITGSATTTTAAATAAAGEQHINGNVSVPPHTRRSLYQLQALRSAHNLKAPAHSIPPRYQPPPQPLGGGILKTPTNSKRHTAYYTDQLQLKYPPDIPQLSAVYIPDSVKAQQQQQQQQHQQQAHRYLPTTHRQSQVEMLKFVRKPEQDHPSPNASVTSSTTGIPTVNGGGSNVGSGSVNGAGRLTAEQNRQLQSLVNELRALKEQNQRLLDDNQELRDLCCFLDDDRQKGRKLAREWQRFGRYTASVMRQEVAAYQNKLRQLDDKQQELITDNLELKELCLYLDEERAHVAANALCAGCGTATRNALRDDGDGSSSSTNADETMTALRNYERQLPDLQLRNASLNDQTLQYVRSLERRIQQLEEERVTTTPTAQLLQQQQQQQQQTQQQLPPPPPPAPQLKLTQQQKPPQQQQQQTLTDATLGGEPIAGRPEAVVRALQVLEVREQLERDRLGNHLLHHHTPHHHIHHQQHQQQHNHLSGNNSSALDQMDDGEKALVREMCNVVWRKLEGSPGNGGPTTLEPL